MKKQISCDVGNLILIKTENQLVKATVSSIEISKVGIKLYAKDENGDTWDFWDIQEGDFFIVPLNVGDTVKIKADMTNGYPIGTICNIINIDYNLKSYIDCIAYEVVPLNDPASCGYWYVEDDLEKGSLQWTPDGK